MTALVRGHVQGVGYRQYVQRRARDLNVGGYAENLPDGGVEVVAEGHEQDLERLLHWIRRGPPFARVEDVQVQRSEATGLKEFHTY